MRIHPTSDIHLEFLPKKDQRKVLNSIPNKDVDVLVVAGDFATGFKKNMKPGIKILCDRFPHVVFVLGNHDYFFSTLEERHNQLSNLDSKIENFHFLEKSSVEIDGQRFVGGALWYPKPDMPVGIMGWIDHIRVHPDQHPTATYNDITREHEYTRKFFLNNVKAGDIIVTHHLPSYACVMEPFIGDPWSCYFATKCEDIIDKCNPAVWCCGHTHFPLNLEIYDTWVVANPYGYPMDRHAKYDSDFIIDTEVLGRV